MTARRLCIILIFYLARFGVIIFKFIIYFGFATGDTIGIDIDAEEKPTVYRL